MSTLPLPGTAGPHRLATAIAYGISDTGPVRDSNEDNFLVDTRLNLLAVADGMGGHQAGGMASAVALEALCRSLTESTAKSLPVSDDPDATLSDATLQAVSVLYDSVEFVNASVYARNVARQMSEGSGMGTTLTGFWRPQVNGPLIVFHVGDSRLYRFSQGALSQLTRDQTWYQQALEAGKIDHLPARNLLLQAIGPSQRVEPEIHSQRVQAGDVLMLCSDGLHGCVPHQEIANVLANVTASTLQAASQQLIRLAAEYDGRDNVTVVLAVCTA